MANDNPFNTAMDQQDSDTETAFDRETFVEQLNDGPKNETVGIAVTTEMHRFWQELRDAKDVDVDAAESIRQHLQNLAQRHPTVAERAGRKLEIDRELSD